MDKVRKNPKNTGADVSVTDPTQNAGANATPLNQALANLHEAAVAGGEHFAADAPNTGITVGGLASGTDISGQSAKEVLESILYPEYAPRWKGAEIKKFVPVAGTLLETGSTVPTTAVANFSISTSPASAEGGSYTASGGAATYTITCNAEETGVAKTTFGTVTYTLTSAFAAGNTVVKTSKGNPTNKTAANTTTLLSAASANGSIDASTKQIKAITATATATIKFVDAIYANTSTIGTMTKRLTDAAILELTFPAETPEVHHAISIPESYRITKIELKSPVSGDFGNYELNKFVATSEVRTIADGSTKEYLKYTRNDGESDSNTFKFYITRG